MKQNRLISIGTFILVLALSGLMTGCMEKDVYDPNRKKEPLPDPDKYFGFEMRSDVRLSVNYDIYGFTPLIEIYGENPMETVEGTPIKKEGIEALFKTYTDNSGKYEGKMQLPTYLNKVYLYTATWGFIIRKTKCSPLFKRSDISYKTKRPPKNNFPKYSRGSKKNTGKFCFSQCFFL